MRRFCSYVAQHDTAIIVVTIGDCATTKVDGSFRLVYLLRNTITNLITQDAKVQAFRNAAAHLEPGGLFVIENYVPELRRLPAGETIHVFVATPTHLGFRGLRDRDSDCGVPSLMGDRGLAQAVLFDTLLCLACRAGPDGSIGWTDLGVHPWSGWDRTAFTGDSRSHSSVWQKAAK